MTMRTLYSNMTGFLCLFNCQRWYSPTKDFQKQLQKVGLSANSTHDHRIPFRRSNWQNYQAMNSTHNQSQLFTANPISYLCFIQFNANIYANKVLNIIHKQLSDLYQNNKEIKPSYQVLRLSCKHMLQSSACA